MDRLSSTVVGRLEPKFLNNYSESIDLSRNADMMFISKPCSLLYSAHHTLISSIL